MRTDQKVSRKSFRHSEQWERDGLTGRATPEIDMRLGGGEVVNGRFVAHALSGNERNHLFLNHQGSRFSDISLVSGLDTPADSRGFVLWDYDRDGWQDIALVNANSPLLNLYRNHMGTKTSSEKAPNGVVAIRFVGANQSASPSQWSCRDGYGAIVTLALPDYKLKREHRCGEGYATQNSNTMIVGIGDNDMVAELTVRWPAGTLSTLRDVSAGTLVTVYEDANQSPSTDAFVQTSYRTSAPRISVPGTNEPSIGRSPVSDNQFRLPADPLTDSARLRLYTTMATWCPSCKLHLPQLSLLRNEFDNEWIDLVGVPIDKEDDHEKLEQYVKQWNPSYRLLDGMQPDQRDKTRRFVNELTGLDTLPSTIVTDGKGNVLQAMPGVPTLSDIRRLMAELPQGT